jgi:hypothetical protein
MGNAFSLTGTSLFWGAGVTLRFLLVLWVPAALGITSNAMPTYLNAMVAVGIVLGPGCREAGDVGTVSRCMPAGILIGVAVILCPPAVAAAGCCCCSVCSAASLLPSPLLQERGSAVGRR